MELLHIEATEKTPLVKFDPANGAFEIRGKSIPQDADSFYIPILEWMEEYVNNPNSITKVVLDLEYFNISSSKRILFILYKLNELVDKGTDVTVDWYYIDQDDDMKEVGQDFAFMVRVPFSFIAHKRYSPQMASA